MSSVISVQEYQIEYPTVNLKIRNSNERLYDYSILTLYTMECEKGFKVKKINKTTNKGTKVTFEPFKSKEDIQEYKKFLENKMAEYNEKWKANVRLNS